MQRAQDTPGLEAICDYYDGGYGAVLLLSLLNHGLEDCYFISTDEETGELITLYEMNEKQQIQKEKADLEKQARHGSLLRRLKKKKRHED